MDVAIVQTTPIDKLIQRIYLAAVNPARWQDFLALLCETVDGGNAVVTITDRQNGGSSVTAYYGLSEEAIRMYHDKYMFIDPYAQGTAALGPLIPGFIGLAQQVMTEDAFQRTEFFRDFGHEHGCIGGLVCVVYADGPLVAIVGVNRKPGRYFGEPEVDLFRRMFPHLRTGMQIHRELLAELQIGRAAMATLNRLQVPAFICDEDGRVLHSNGNAESTGAWLAQGGRIAPINSSDRRLLRRAIARAAEGGNLKRAADSSVVVTSPSGVPTAVTVSPVHQQTPVGLLRPMVAVIVGDRPVLSSPSVTALLQAYGLSLAERNLALRLASGRSLKEAAADLRITYQTARTHLKHVFSKTESNRQAESIRKILASTVTH